jgi:hypothetical protein
MADLNWNRSGNALADFYAGRMAPPIKLPDGTYIPAPNLMPVEEMYRGIYPPPSIPGPLKSRSVSTVPVDNYGNPTGTAPSMADTRGERWGAGAGDPSWAEGYEVAPDGSLYRNTPTTQVAQPSTIDTTNPIDFWRQGLAPTAPQSPALDAIDQLTGSGRSTAQPFPLMGFNRPTVPGGSGAIGRRDQAWVDQGPDMAALNEITVRGGKQMPQMPRQRPNPPSIPGPLYKIKSGDTLSALAKKFGTTVGQLANANNISDPNKIRAGSTLNLAFMAPPVPRMPSPMQRTPPQTSTHQPEGFGSKGYSAGGNLIREMYGH